jgi:preprotein translocase subunit YajC
MLIRPQGREQARRREMLASVKKTDRVVTTGGIYGVVTSIDAEAGEITIKVDEATNTKLRMTLSSIAQVVGDKTTEDTASK